MQFISKLLKIRFFLLVAFLAVAVAVFWDKIPEFQKKYPFTISWLQPPTYNELNFKEQEFHQAIRPNLKGSSIQSSGVVNYLIFTDGYISNKQLKMILKSHQGSIIHKVDLGEESIFFLQSPRLADESRLNDFKTALDTQSITYKVMKIVGNIEGY